MLSDVDLSGDELMRVLATLANPHRMRVVAGLVGRRVYVSQLARELGISRPLLQVHLRRLEQAGLVSAKLEFSEEGKAMKFYRVRPFSVSLTPQSIATAAQTLAGESAAGGELEDPSGRPGSTR